jgi:hypothetical protein
MKGVIDSWAIRWAYTHFKNDAFCIFPVKSKVKNVGTDSSGTHSKATNKYDVLINNDERGMILTNNLKLNDEIMRSMRKFVQPTLFRRFLNLLKYKITINEVIL